MIKYAYTVERPVFVVSVAPSVNLFVLVCSSLRQMLILVPHVCLRLFFVSFEVVSVGVTATDA